MSEQHDIVQMETIGDDQDGRTVTVVGIPSHLTETHPEAAASLWLQDGVAVEVLFDEETYRAYGHELRGTAAVLIRGRVEWHTPDGYRVQLMRLHAEYAEARELVGIQTEAY